jgi:Helicase conserved C-terminal domain
MRITLSRALKQKALSDLSYLHDLWVGGGAPASREQVVKLLVVRMQDGAAAATVRAKLDPSAEFVFRALLQSPGKAQEFDAIRESSSRDGLTSTEVRSALASLVQVGLGVNVSMRDAGHTSNLWGAPSEVARALRDPETKTPSPCELLSLKGWLIRHLRAEGQAKSQAEAQASTLHRLLGAVPIVRGRVQGLAESVRIACEKIALEHGGILAVRELEGAGIQLSANELRQELEEASLGTVGDLDLERHGLRQRGQVVALFNETLRAILTDPERKLPEPQDIASIGVDFVSNFDRFANFVDDETIRFTVRGSIFKSTGKRLAERLLPNPGREFGRLEILEMEYRFALAFRLIDRTGQRSFRVTKDGKEFLSMPLMEKQRSMLDCLTEDRDMPGDVVHQLPMRRLLLGVLRHFEPGVWLDAMSLPFLARHHYLSELPGEDAMASDNGSFPLRASSDLNGLAWNLFTWVRKHLYLLGFIDMGYDVSGRASCIRLTDMGAEFLGMIPATELTAAGHVVVNPDFEVVLFPGERSHELVYRLDRFADREKSDNLVHYRMTPSSLHRALSEGVSLDEVLGLLRQLSRTPLPQNVEYSLESWARSDGMVTYRESESMLTCESAEILDRIARHPELGRIGLDRLDRNHLRICGPVDLDPLADWIRDYGVSIRVAG